MPRKTLPPPRDTRLDTQKPGGFTDFQSAPRAAQALRLRRLGHTYDQIAQQCGFATASGARKMVKQASQRIVRDEAQALVGWQLDMIDQALQVVMSRIVVNDGRSLFAVDRLTPLLKRQAELMGLDRPVESASQAQMVVVAIPGDLLEAV